MEVSDKLTDWVRQRFDEYQFIARHTKDPAKQLSATSKELAYFDVLKAIERINAGGQP